VALLALGLLGLAVMGVLSELWDQRFVRLFDLDRERRAAALFSALLLVGAAGTLLMALRRGRLLGLPTAGLPVLLAFMALDEWNKWHERLEAALSTDWQLLYAPIILAGGVAWLLVLRRWGLRSPTGLLLVLGAAAWGVSQVLEAVQWDFGGDVQRAGYVYYMVTEEVLEAFGSACFLLAGVVGLTRPGLPGRTRRAGGSMAP
jgi:hypothetical protein